MDSKVSTFVFLVFFLVASASASAFDILKLLEKDSDLTEFSKLIKDSKLAHDINQRQTITVLAVGNGGLKDLSSKTPEEIKIVLSAHVILDYYDEPKLKDVIKKEKTKTLVTMYQTTGEAQNKQGFINVGLSKEGDVVFGSAAKGAVLNSKLEKLVTAQPYNISVLEVSSLIEIPSAGAGPVSSPPPAGDDEEAPAPSEDEEEDDEEAASPPEPEEEDAESPSESPVEVPAKAPAPAEKEEDNKSAPAPAQSAASRVEMALGAGLVMGLAALLA